MQEKIHVIIALLRICVPAAYFVVSLGYIWEFAKNQSSRPAWLRPLFASGIFLHVLLYAVLFYAHGPFPFGTVFRGLFLCSWVFAVFSFAIETMARERSYGAFLGPVNFTIALLAAIFLNRGDSLPQPPMSPYFVVHVTLLFVAYALFFFSAAVSVMYLIQYNEIKHRRLRAIFRRLPPLEVMDQAVMRADGLGLGLLFLGIVIGFLWMDYATGADFRMNLKIGFTIFAAAVYLIEHLFRIGRGWKGQRACMVSLLGFALLIINLVIGRHGY